MRTGERHSHCPIRKCRGVVDVIDSRTTPDDGRRRRYRCQKCGHRYTTYELSPEASLEYVETRRKASKWDRFEGFIRSLSGP